MGTGWGRAAAAAAVFLDKAPGDVTAGAGW